MIPRYAGDYKFQNAILYFDPQAGAYKMLKGKEYSVRVEKEMNPVKDPGRQPYSRSRKKMSGCWDRIFVISNSQERSPSEKACCISPRWNTG